MPGSPAALDSREPDRVVAAELLCPGPLTGAEVPEPGHTYEVDLELDTAPRVVELPAELTEAFAAEPALADAWAAMSYSNQRRLAEPIGAAKGEDTRARRIAKAIAELPSVTREHSPLTLPSPCERPSRDEIARGARDRTPAGAISNRTCDLVPSGDRLRFRLVPCSRSP